MAETQVNPQVEIEKVEKRNAPGVWVSFTSHDRQERVALITLAKSRGPLTANLVVFGAQVGESAASMEYDVPYSADSAPYSWKFR